MTRGSPDRTSDLGDEGMEPAAAIARRRVANRHEAQRGRRTVARSRTENRFKAALNKGAEVSENGGPLARVGSRINPQRGYQA
jgi:hypothetical protein